jgi:hypothetical protein
VGEEEIAVMFGLLVYKPAPRLGRVDKPDPDTDAAEQNEAEETGI